MKCVPEMPNMMLDTKLNVLSYVKVSLWSAYCVFIVWYGVASTSYFHMV